MTRLVNDAADFADQALDGLVAAHGRHVRKVHGDVARATQTEVSTGRRGHRRGYRPLPRLRRMGWPGLAHGAACGNIFSSHLVPQRPPRSYTRSQKRPGGRFATKKPADRPARAPRTTVIFWVLHPPV